MIKLKKLIKEGKKKNSELKGDVESLEKSMLIIRASLNEKLWVYVKHSR